MFCLIKKNCEIFQPLYLCTVCVRTCVWMEKWDGQFSCVIWLILYVKCFSLYLPLPSFYPVFEPVRPCCTSDVSKATSWIPQLHSQTLLFGTPISLHFWSYPILLFPDFWCSFWAPIMDPETWFFSSIPPWCSFRTFFPDTQCLTNSTKP